MNRGLSAILRGPRIGRVVESRHSTINSFQAYQSLFTFNGNQYTVGNSYRAGASPYLMSACGPVHSVLDRRVSVLGEALPIFQSWVKGRPDDTFASRELQILKSPWPGGTWRHLVAACEADVASGGNSYWIRETIDGVDQLVRLDPDRTSIVAGSYVEDGVEVGERLLGYIVQHQRYGKGQTYDPGEVAHYRPGAPLDCPFRGQSWLASVAYDASSDVELTSYKGNYLKNGAMPSLAVMYEPTLSMDALEQFVPVFADKFTGSLNAGKVMHFLGGRDVKTVGATLEQLAFKAVQGAGETRIAAAAGVPAVVAMFSEGMQGSSLNAGNYGATRRLFADIKARPLLGSLCDAFSALVKVPSDARLWYDDSGVSFFQEDVADDANIRATLATVIVSLINAGFDPDAAVAMAQTGRVDALKGKHSGLTSVQLQPPNPGDPEPAAVNEGE